MWPKTRGQRCWPPMFSTNCREPASESQAGAPGNLDGGDQEGCARGLRRLRRNLGHQIRQGVECLTKDREALLAFYDFPAEHWKHLRTTNPVESTFATVRNRTVRSRNCLSNKTALAMIFKLAQAAENSWHRLREHDQLPKVILGVKFNDGIEVVRSQAQTAPPDPARHQDSALHGERCGHPRQSEAGRALEHGNTSQAVFADSAYRSAEIETKLKARGFNHVRATRSHHFQTLNRKRN